MMGSTAAKKLKTRQALTAHKARLLESLIREHKFPANIDRFWVKLKDMLNELIKFLQEK